MAAQILDLACSLAEASTKVGEPSVDCDLSVLKFNKYEIIEKVNLSTRFLPSIHCLRLSLPASV